MVDALKLIRHLKRTNKGESQRENLTKESFNPEYWDLKPLQCPQLFRRETCFEYLDENDLIVHPKAIILEDPSGAWASGTGATLWDSSIALTDYLLQAQRDVCANRNAKFLELGAGLGLPSIVLSQVGCKVHSSERPIMIPLLSKNLEENGVLGSVYESVGSVDFFTSKSNFSSPRPTPVDIVILDWITCDISALERVDYSVIIGADLVFRANRDCWEMLANNITALLRHQMASNQPAPPRISSTSPLHMIASTLTEADVRINAERKKVAWLAFEAREAASEVFHEFFEIMLGEQRGIELKRMSIETTPSDIYIVQMT